MNTNDQLNDALIDQAAKTLAALDPCHDTVVLLGRVVMERDRLKAQKMSPEDVYHRDVLREFERQAPYGGMGAALMTVEDEAGWRLKCG